MIGKLTRTIVRTFAFALALCATTSAWAVTANVVWESDFGTSTKTGLDGKTYTLAFPTGCESWLQQNGTIKIGSNGNAHGPTITVTGGVQGEKVSVLMEYADATAQSAAVPVYIAAGAWLGSQTKDNSLEVTGHWWNGGGVAYPTAGGTVTTMPTAGYLMYIFAQGDNVEIYSAGTLAGLSDASAGGAATGLNTANRTVTKIALGGVMIGGNGAGLTSRPVSNFNGLTIKRVAIFTSKISASEAAAYKFPSDETKVTVTEANTSWSTAFPSWDDSADNSDKTLFIEIQEGASLSKDTALSVKGLFVTGPGSLTLSGAVTASNGITIGSGATVSISANTGSAITNYGTLNVNGCTVSGAITNNGTVNANGCAFTGAVSNSGTLNTSGTVSFSSSASNTSSGTFNVVSGTTTYNSSSQKGISGTLNIAKNATLINGKQDSILWDGTVHVYISGIVTMNAKWTIGANNYIHLYDGALVNGSAGNAFHFNSGEGKIIAETGSSTITAPFVKGGGTIAKSGSGTLRLENQRLPSIKGSEGTIEVVSTESHVDSKHSHTDSNIPFSGTVKFITSSSPSGQYHMLLWSNSATAGMFANRPALDVSGEVRLYDKIAAYPLAVRNLCGTGTIRMGGGTSVSGYRYIDTSQTANTVFDGMFTTISEYAAYDPALTVRGADDATEIYSLTLTGANNTTGPLVIENNAKVIFSSTGKWSGGTVTVKNGGVLESQNSAAVAATLAVQEGATLKFANGVPLAATEYNWSGVSNDQSVNVDLSGIAPSATPVTLIASDVTVAASKFKVTASQTPATLSVENSALKATFANVWRDGTWNGSVSPGENATLYISQNSTLTVSEALTLGTVTVVKEGEDDVTLTISGAGALTTGGWTIPAGVTVVTADGMEIAGDVTGGGIINVPAKTTLTMDGVTISGDTSADRVKVTVSGTLKTKGTTTLSGNNISESGSLIRVLSGKTTCSFGASALKGNLTIDSDAELLLTNTGSYLWNTIPTSATLTIDVSGKLNVGNGTLIIYSGTTINLREGARIEGNNGFPANANGALLWFHDAPLYAYGNAEIDAIVNTQSGTSPTFTVADNVTLTISQSFLAQSGDGYGYCGGSITKAGAGTLKLSNIAMTKPIMAGTGDIGTVELTSTSGNKEHTATGATFNGILHLTNTGSNQHIFKTTAAAFADGVRPEWILDSSDTYFSNDYYPGKEFYVRNLSGSGTFKAQYTSGSHVYTINTMQERNTVFSGIFTSADSRSSCLTVVGDGSGAVNSLTLQNASSSTNTLTVSDNAKVVFASNGSTSGKWADGRVVVNANGWLESSISDAVKNLTLASGSHLVFPTESTAWTGITNITSTGTIDCSIGNGNTPAVGAYLINWTEAGLASAPGGTYSMSGAAAATVALKADTTGLKVVSPAASLTKSTGVTSSYADTMSAFADFINSRTTDIGCYVTILDDSEPLDDASLRTYQLVYDSSSKTYRHAVARIGAQGTGVFYSSLETALDSAVGGETVTLMFNNTDASITIPANVTLEIPAAYSISGTIAGAGAVDAKADFAPTFGEWTGTFIMDWADTANTKSTKIAFDKYGIGGSTVQLNQNYKGWLANTEGTGVASDIQPTVILNATLHVADGYSKNPNGADAWKDTTKFSKLKSTSNGQLSLEGSPGGSGYKYYFHIDTLESFEGSITINGNYCLKIGKYNFPDYASASSFVVGTKLVALTYTTGSTIYNSSLQDPATAGIDVAMLGSTIPGNKLVYDTDGFYPAAAAVLISETTNYYKTYAAAAAAAVAAEVRRMTGTDAMATGAGSLPSGWYPEGALTDTYVLPVASAKVTIDDPYVYGSTKVVTRYYASLADAIAAVDSEGTVTLMDNTGEAISLGKSIALDGDSYTFSGTFTGSGTLILGAPLAAADPARWAEGWTGTVELKDITTVITDFDFADYGNANSTVRANNVLVRMPETGGEYGNVGEINLVGEGLRFGGDPIAGQDFTFSAAISGTGKIRVGTRCQTASPAHTRYIFKGDLSDFAGGVDYNDTGWYKATIVFQAGTDEIPAGNNGEWGQIILTGNTTISLGGEMYGPAGIIVAGSINVLDGGSVRVDTSSGQKIEGSGTITYATFPASAPAFNNSWSGEVHLPGSASIAETNFGNWGKSGSKIVLDGDVAGRIAQNTSVSAEMVLDGHSLTVNDFSPSSYSFSKISGSGNISFNHKENGYQPSSLTIGEIAPTYSGTVNNNTTTTLAINKLVLPNLPPCDAKVLAVGGTGEISLDVGNVKVNEESLPAKYKLERRHVGEEGDGFYVYYYGTIFSVW